MPNGFYLCNGWVTQTDLYILGTKVDDFATQSDMSPSGRQWLEPGNEASRVVASTLVKTPGGRKYPYGGYGFKWPLQNLSPNMVNFIWQNLFFGYFTMDATAQTFNRATGDWEVYWAVANMPDYNDAQLSAGGYNDFAITFSAGRFAPP